MKGSDILWFLGIIFSLRFAIQKTESYKGYIMGGEPKNKDNTKAEVGYEKEIIEILW